MSGNGHNGSSNPGDLTTWVQGARRGLRRDVEALMERLDLGELFVPLASPVPGASVGEELELDDDLTLTPHLLADDEGNLYCALFTRADILEPMIAELGWTTDGGPLEYCSLPARIGLDLAIQIVDEERVLGLVLNAGHESELMLKRLELGSIAKGKAVPLVGYVREIPVQDFEKTLVAEGELPSGEFIATLERCIEALGCIDDYEITRTFNADRDIEPHLTLSLRPNASAIDYEDVTKRLIEALGDLVPPPGYIDIIFDRSPKSVS
jgi:hypothetical protein